MPYVPTLDKSPAVEAAVMSRYNLRPAIDIYVSVEGRDLGGLAAAGLLQRVHGGALPRPKTMPEPTVPKKIRAGCCL